MEDGQRRELLDLSVKHRIWADQETIYPRLDQACEHVAKFASGARAHDPKLQSACASCRRYISRHGVSEGGIGGIDKQGNGCGRGHQIMQQLQLLWRQFAAQKGHARDVAAGSIKTSHKPQLNRITPKIKDDGDRRCRVSDSENWGGADHND